MNFRPGRRPRLLVCHSASCGFCRLLAHDRVLDHRVAEMVDDRGDGEHATQPVVEACFGHGVRLLRPCAALSLAFASHTTRADGRQGRGKIGRPLASGQAVRRLTLDQEIEGSNPSSPANNWAREDPGGSPPGSSDFRVSLCRVMWPGGSAPTVSRARTGHAAARTEASPPDRLQPGGWPRTDVTCSSAGSRAENRTDRSLVGGLTPGVSSRPQEGGAWPIEWGGPGDQHRERPGGRGTVGPVPDEHRRASDRRGPRRPTRIACRLPAPPPRSADRAAAARGHSVARLERRPGFDEPPTRIAPAAARTARA